MPCHEIQHKLTYLTQGIRCLCWPTLRMSMRYGTEILNYIIISVLHCDTGRIFVTCTCHCRRHKWQSMINQAWPFLINTTQAVKITGNNADSKQVSYDGFSWNFGLCKRLGTTHTELPNSKKTSWSTRELLLVTPTFAVVSHGEVRPFGA